MGWWQALWGLPEIEGAERLPHPSEIRSSTAPETGGTMPAALQPPPRESRLQITQDKALSLIPVYRAFSIIAGAVSQLTLDVWRGEEAIRPPTWVRQPDVKMSRSAFFEQTVTSLAASGNAFWKVERDSPTDQPTALLVLNPYEVAIHEDGTFSHRGKALPRWKIQHLALLRVPGMLRGLGPIQAASLDLLGASDLRGYAAEWFETGTIPNGVLSTDHQISSDQATEMKARWVASVNGREPAVLGNGLGYKPLLISPKDAQFLESRQFTTTDIARLFGIPAHLMHAVVEGGSMTYMSGQAADLSFIRWTLMAYLREIEEAFSALLSRNQHARFNVDAILRTTTKERYEAHKIALDAGFLTTNEVREIEGMSPVPEGTSTATARELTEMVQKVYLGVGKVLTANEARSILNSAGASLSGEFAPDAPAPAPAPSEEESA